jgi:hypothetical protein
MIRIEDDSCGLTIGKHYDIIDTDKHYVYVKDDMGNRRWFDVRRFISLQEHRERLLKELIEG